MKKKANILLQQTLFTCNKLLSSNPLAIILFVCLFFITQIPLSADELPELVPQIAHDDIVFVAEFSPDGRYLASGGYDNKIVVWELESGRELFTLHGHTRQVRSLAFSGNGNLLASASVDKTARLWNLITGEQIHTFTSNDTVLSVVFTPDDKQLITTGADKQISFWDLKTLTRSKILKGHRKAINALVINKTGTQLISCSDDTTIRIWNLNNYKLQKTLRGHKFGISNLDLHKDGELLVSAGGWDKTVKLWDIKSQNLLHTFNYGASIDAVAFSPDGKYIAAGGGKKVIRIWQIDNKQHIKDLNQKYRIENLSFSPVNDILAVAGYNKMIKLWSLQQSTVLKTLRGHGYEVMAAAFSPDGSLLATAGGSAPRGGTGDYSIKLWDLKTGRNPGRLAGHKDTVNRLLFNPDSKLLASAGHDTWIKLWDAKNEKHLFSLREKGRNIGAWIMAMDFSPDNRWLAADNSRKLTIWDLQTQKIVDTVDQADWLSSVKFTPDGKQFATGGGSTIKIWRSNDRQLLKTINAGAIGALELDYSRDGKYLLSGYYQLALWNPLNGQQILKFPGHQDWIADLHIDAKNRRIISTSADRTIKIWSVDPPKLLQTLSGHTNRIHDSALSADERILVTASVDTTVKLWSVETGELLLTLISNDKPYWWLAMTPDGFFDGTREGWSMVPFRFPSERFLLFEPERFFNQFYQPNLLVDIMREAKPIREILASQGDNRAELNISRYQRSRLPEVTLQLAKLQQNEQSRYVDLIVNAKDTGSGLQDLRVFRNDILVHFEHGDLYNKASGENFNMRLKIKLTDGINQIRAYAFNGDNVKSKDATVTVKRQFKSAPKGTTYIIAIGINDYQNTDFDLNYAVRDAEVMSTTLQNSFKKLNDSASQIKTINLHNSQANKRNILLLFDLLSGKIQRPPASAPVDFAKLKSAEPEDKVIVYFSGHGMSVGDQYYLIPHDLDYQGNAQNINKRAREQIAASSVSDQELEKGFEKIDAGNIMLIIDACQSGQALETEEKRRGPMNSRGLAQLAYEKGIYILAAAQSYQAALELQKLGHGLLTYTLIEQGLKNMAADSRPADGIISAREWLDYAVQKVPQTILDTNTLLAQNTGGKGVDYDEITVTGQAPKAYYRREVEQTPWLITKRP